MFVSDAPRAVAQASISSNDTAPRAVGQGGGAASASGAMGLGDGIRRLWAVRWYAFVGGLLMTIAATAFWALAEPAYESSAQVYIDPKDLQLLSRELTPNLMPGDSGTVIIESQARIMQSAAVLRAVVEELGLADDPEFNGEGTGLSLATIKAAVKGLLVEPDGRSVDRVQVAVDQLARQVTVVRADRTYVIGVYARARAPEKAAAIANGMVEAYLELREGQRAAQADSASRSLEGRLEELFAKLEASEDAVERYKVESGLVGAGGSLLIEDRLAQASRDVSAAEIAVDRARAQREQLAPMRSSPERFLASTEALGSADVARLRGELERVEGLIGTLEATLGPRHPRRVEAESQRETVRRSLQAEIGRLYANAVLAEERATAQLNAAAQTLSRLTGDVQQSDASRVRLRQLERDAQSGRSVYEEALLRSRETREQESVSTINVQLVSPATPAIRKSFPPSLTVLLPLAFALGAMLGTGIGLASGLVTAPVRPDTRRDRRAGDRASTLVRPAAAMPVHAAPAPRAVPVGKGWSTDDASAGSSAPAHVVHRSETAGEAAALARAKLEKASDVPATASASKLAVKPAGSRSQERAKEPATSPRDAAVLEGPSASDGAPEGTGAADASATTTTPVAPSHMPAAAGPASSEPAVSSAAASARTASEATRPTTPATSAGAIQAASRLERDPRFARIAERVGGQPRRQRAWHREPSISRGAKAFAKASAKDPTTDDAAATSPAVAASNGKPRIRLDAATVAAVTTVRPEPRP